MIIASPFTRATLCIVLVVAVGACSQKSPGGGVGTGGDSSSGGATGSGGAVSSGGSSGRGGSMGSGGTSSLGAGGSASGGAVGAGGTTASAGAPGGGGGAAAGGADGGGTAGTAGGGNAGSGGKSGGATGTVVVRGSGGAAGGVAGTIGAGGTSGGNTGTAVAGGGGGNSGAGGGNGGTGGGTAAMGDCTDTSTSTLSFTKQYEGGSIAVTGSTKTYYANSNWWHKFGGQTVSLAGLSMKIGNAQGASVPATDGNPMGFPTVYIGAYSGHETVDSNLPKQVSAIKSVPTVFQTNASSLDTSNLNATYDVWFTASGGKLTSATQNNPGKGGAYLMVWMFKPQDRQPRGGTVDSKGVGTPNYADQAVDGVPGTWDVWVDPSDPLCISYVSSTPIDGLAFDLNKFIQDSVAKKYGITSSMYLNLVFAGFEIWSGGDGLQAKQFCAAVN